jgi:hypothetical protein
MSLEQGEVRVAETGVLVVVFADGGRCRSSTLIIPEGLAVVVVPAAVLLRLK